MMKVCSIFSPILKPYKLFSQLLPSRKCCDVVRLWGMPPLYIYTYGSIFKPNPNPSSQEYSFLYGFDPTRLQVSGHIIFRNNFYLFSNLDPPLFFFLTVHYIFQIIYNKIIINNQKIIFDFWEIESRSWIFLWAYVSLTSMIALNLWLTLMIFLILFIYLFNFVVVIIIIIYINTLRFKFNLRIVF